MKFYYQLFILYLILKFMKHIAVCMIVGIGIWCNFTSCSESSSLTPKEEVVKRIEITLEGDMERLSRYTKVHVSTETSSDIFSFIMNKDTIPIKHYFTSDSISTKPTHYVFESNTKFTTVNFHITFRYLHIISNPTDNDNVTVKIKAYKNNKLAKEDSCILQALDYSCLKKKYRPSENTYIHNFAF